MIRALLTDIVRRKFVVEDKHASYDELLRRIKDIVKERPVVTATNYNELKEIVVQLSDVRIGKPETIDSSGERGPATPQICRIRALYYSAPVYVRASIKVFRLERRKPADEDYVSPETYADWFGGPLLETGSGPVEPAQLEKFTHNYRRVLVGPETVLPDGILMYVPVMVKSSLCQGKWLADECPFDSGGYYIIRRVEKIIQAQKAPVPNRILVTEVRKLVVVNKYSLQAEIRSAHPTRSRSTVTMYLLATRSKPVTLDLIVPYIESAVPIAVYFRLIGFHDKDFLQSAVAREIAKMAQTAEDAAAATELFRENFYNELFVKPMPDVYDWLLNNVSASTTTIKTRKAMHYQFYSETLPHVLQDTESSEELFEEFLKRRVVDRDLRARLDRKRETEMAVAHNKLLFMAIACSRLLLTYVNSERYPVDSRDFEGNKTYQNDHILVATMIRQRWTEWQNKLRSRLYASMLEPGGGVHINLHDELQRPTLSRLIEEHFARGSFIVKRDRSNKSSSSTVQLMNHINMFAREIHMSRVNVPVSRDGKLKGDVRELHVSTMGMLCPSATPEGEDVGLVNTLAIAAHLRIGNPWFLFADVIKSMMPDESPLSSKRVTVFCNGTPLCETGDAGKLIAAARAARRAGVLPFDCSVTEECDGVHIDTDDGIVTMPLLVYDRLCALTRDEVAAIELGGSPLRTAMRLGVVEYLSVREIFQTTVAPSLKQCQERIQAQDWTTEELALMREHGREYPWTHVLVHPCQTFGLAANFVPFMEHNQGPRITYFANMLSQFLCFTFSTAATHRVDVGAYELTTLQRPICSTDVEVALNAPPMGINALLAIMEYAGLNTEDAIVMKKEFLERGAFRTVIYRTFSVEIQNPSEEFMCNPLFDNEKYGVCMNRHDDDAYLKIGLDGLPLVGTHVKFGDVIIGKTSIQTVMDEMGVPVQRRYDKSRIFNYDNGIVDKVILTENRESHRLVHVKVRSVRIPVVGDKFTTRHGQKGTIGIIESEINLPQIAEGPMAGMVPDVIVAPSCIPSRMTAGQLIEMAAGSYAMRTGISRIDAEAWSGFDITAIEDESCVHKVSVISGITGRLMDTPVAVGLVHMSRLKHMVDDKIRARTEGRRDPVTQQPTGGRKGGGGVRAGEMELHVIGGHGAMRSWYERTRECSDAYEIRVCKDCGHMNDTAKATLRSFSAEVADVRAGHCQMCGSPRVFMVPSIYALHVLAQEMSVMGVYVKAFPSFHASSAP